MFIYVQMQMLDPCSYMFRCKCWTHVSICLDANVGPPLNADDFALAAVLPKPNITHEEMHQLVAEGEQKAYFNKPTRNIMATIK